MTDTAVDDTTTSNTYIIRPNFQHKLVDGIFCWFLPVIPQET